MPIYCNNDRCERRVLCERAKIKYKTLGVIHFNALNKAECSDLIMRSELTQEADIFRPKNRPRHNQHADREKQTPESLGIQRPNLNVKRHIVNKEDINQKG